MKYKFDTKNCLKLKIYSKSNHLYIDMSEESNDPDKLIRLISVVPKTEINNIIKVLEAIRDND